MLISSCEKSEDDCWLRVLSSKVEVNYSQDLWDEKLNTWLAETKQSFNV